MRYVDGETLEATIAKLANGDATYHRQYTFERRAELFLGILHAIQYAHAKQIIHRDIKPANIMIGPFGEVVVMDWGIAKRRGDAEIAATADEASNGPMFQTRVGSLVGTPAYMSPEQATGRTDEIDERSDVYSLSVLFYELLTLQHYLPKCSSVPELLLAIADGAHEPASRMTNPNPHQSPVPAELGWYVEKGLAKDPRARYQSVTEMIDALHRLLAGDFAVQCPVTFMKKVGGNGVRLTDRYPIASMIGATALLALVTFAIVQLARMMI
jgi:serine/threonine-protein kinase